MKVNTLRKLDLIVWMNLLKWQAIKGISDKKIAACLGIKDLHNRRTSYYLTTREIGRVCEILEIEPQKLFEI